MLKRKREGLWKTEEGKHLGRKKEKEKSQLPKEKDS